MTPLVLVLTERWLCRGGGEHGCRFNFVRSFCFIFVSFFVHFFCLWYSLSHHLQGRVHDRDLVGFFCVCFSSLLGYAIKTFFSVYYFRYISSSGRKTHLKENGVSPEPNLCWCKLNALD